MGGEDEIVGGCNVNQTVCGVHNQIYFGICNVLSMEDDVGGTRPFSSFLLHVATFDKTKIVQLNALLSLSLLLCLYMEIMICFSLKWHVKITYHVTFEGIKCYLCNFYTNNSIFNG